MHTVICYGDSNTWGYDPRSPLGEAYEKPWPALLCEHGLSAINFRENGRTIPSTDWEYQMLGRFLSKHSESDTILILLGTNDILRGRSAADLKTRMDALLHYLHQNFPSLSPILLAPPQIQIPEFSELSKLAAICCQETAEENCVEFLNIQEWPIPMAFDGIHFSEEGHAVLAQLLAEKLFYSLQNSTV